ncbi:MAG: YdcF family protein [Bacillota bacterium]
MKRQYKRLALAALTLIICMVGYLGLCWMDVRRGERAGDLTSADAIVVLGAAVWPGGQPSPALLDRANHGAELYRRAKAHQIIVSGGVGKNPPSEAQVAAEIMKAAGIPEEALILDESAYNTWSSAKAVAELAQARGITSLILVSDGFHLARSRAIFEDFGFEVQLSAPHNPNAAIGSYRWQRSELREAVALAAYRVGIHR